MQQERATDNDEFSNSINELFHMLNQFYQHEEVIATNINEVIYNICDNFRKVRKEDQNKIIKIFNKMFTLNYQFDNI